MLEPRSAPHIRKDRKPPGIAACSGKNRANKLKESRNTQRDQILGRRSLCVARLDKKSSLEIKTVNEHTDHPNVAARAGNSCAEGFSVSPKPTLDQSFAR